MTNKPGRPRNPNNPIRLPRYTGPRWDDLPVCETCGERHVTRDGVPSCNGHVHTDRSTYVKGQGRQRLDKPRPCKHNRPAGLTTCKFHGVTDRKIAVARARAEEAHLMEQAFKLIPDVAERTAITNPLETLLELASEANAFRESLRILANRVGEQIRYGGTGGSGEQLRAEVSTYRTALKDTADLLVNIARLDIEKMLARVTVAQAEQALASMRAGMEEAGLTDEQKRTVMTSAGRHLRAVAG